MSDPALSESPRLVDIAVVARHFQVSAEAIRRWIHKGHLRAERTPTGRYKVLADDFEAIKRHAANTCHAPRGST